MFVLRLDLCCSNKYIQFIGRGYVIEMREGDASDRADPSASLSDTMPEVPIIQKNGIYLFTQ